MRVFAGAFALAAMLMTAGGATAAERTVVLKVAQMSCVTCGPIVRKSLARLPGVKRVAVSFESRTATVVFDDAKVSVDALVRATTDAGFPSRPG